MYFNLNFKSIPETLGGSKNALGSSVKDTIVEEESGDKLPIGGDRIVTYPGDTFERFVTWLGDKVVT